MVKCFHTRMFIAVSFPLHLKLPNNSHHQRGCQRSNLHWRTNKHQSKKSRSIDWS